MSSDGIYSDEVAPEGASVRYGQVHSEIYGKSAIYRTVRLSVANPRYLVISIVQMSRRDERRIHRTYYIFA